MNAATLSPALETVARAELTQLPDWLLVSVNSCPPAGSGVHFWLFRVSRQLLVHMGEEAIFALLKSKVALCGRPVPDREIISQIRNARAFAWHPNCPKAFPRGPDLALAVPLPPVPPAWPEADLEQIRRIVARGGGLCDLTECSPVRFDDDSSHAEEIIDTLLPGNPLLCVGKSQSYFATRRREIWRGCLSRLPFIVPNPMLGVLGYTKVENRPSEHTLEQTACRVYLVVEFDISEYARDGTTPSEWAPLVREWRESSITLADACAALHLHLSTHLPLAAVVDTGGKSLHGWYSAFDQSEERLRSFMDYAVRLGADHATWLRSQFVRLPDGLRDNGKRQVTCYLDPGKAVKDE